MNRKSFIESLRKSLKGINPKEVEDIIYDFEEHFDIALSNGENEENIIKNLGDPWQIGKIYRADVLINNATNQISSSNIIRAIFATLGLGFIALVFVLGPLLASLGIILGIFGVSLGLTVGGALLTFGSIFDNFSWLPITINNNHLGYLFFGIGTFASGILIFLIGIVMSKALYFITLRYLKWNIKIIRSENNE
jgi:uncharacterized membrane protein